MEDKSIDELIQILETSDEFEFTRKKEAAESLGEIATGDERAISALVKLLETSIDESTRIRAAESLGKIATGDERAISALVKLLETSIDEFTRIRAAESLGKIATGDERAILALVKLLETSTDENTRRAAAVSLCEIATGDDRAISELVRILETSTEENTRIRAAESLGEIATGDERAISELVRILETSTDEFTHRAAAYILGKIATGDERAILALVKLLERSTNQDTRSEAAVSLGKIAKGNDRAISELVRILETSIDEFTRIRAAESLGEIATGDERAISELARILETSTDENTRRAAAVSLGKIATGDERAISELVRILETSTDEFTHRAAAYILGKIATGDERAILALVKLLERSTNQDTRSEAAVSLGKIAKGNDRAISELVRILETTTDEFTRREAAKRLGEIATGGDRAILALVKLLETSTDKSSRTLAANSLSKIAQGDDRAISELIKLLETTTDESTRRQAADSLGKIATGDDRAISALVKLLEISTDEDTRQQTAYILGQIADIAKPIFAKRQWLGFILHKLSEIGIIILSLLLSLLSLFVLLMLSDPNFFIPLIFLILLIFLCWLINELYLKRIFTHLKNIFFLWFNKQPNQKVAVWVKILSSKNEFIQWQAIKKLGAIANGNKSAIVALIDTLKTSKNEFIQWQAVKSLGKIGINNRKALNATIKFIETTSNEFIQWQSLEQLDHFKVIPLSMIIQIRKKLKENNSPSINSAILNLQKKLDPLERLILKLFNQKLIKGVQQEYSVKTIFGDSIVNYIDQMQAGRDITNRRTLMNSCLKVHQYLVKFALKNTDFNRAFFYTELFRNRYLVERIAQQDAPLPATISKQLAQDINTAKQRERQTLQAYTDGMNQHLPEVELAALSLDWEKAKQTLETLYRQVAEVEPEFIAKTKVYPLSFQEVQDLLPSNTAIIEFFFTENELITLLILPGHESPLIPEELRVNLKPQNHLERLARDWVADLGDKSKSKDNALQTTLEQLPRQIDHLGELLGFSEFEIYLPRHIQQLIIVPNNSLHLFPIHAVPLNPTQRLIDRFSVRYFPNLHIWKICQNRQRSRQSFLGIENPTEDKDLIFAKAEIASISQGRHFRENHEVLPRPKAKAKKSEILEKAKNYHCFHFSGHAEYNFDNPLDSYLMLSEDHQENLTLSTLFADLHIPDADLVTLSACCTGVVDAFQPTDECLGIATGFLLAGAKAVVSSLWKVNSIATAFLLDEFYRQLEQTPDKAVALQKAQNWLRTRHADELRQRANEWDLSKLRPTERFRLERALKRLQGTSFENPYFWAAFIVTGV